MTDQRTCQHTDQILVNRPEKAVAGCEDCLRIGSEWVHLRICLSCGHVGCCDSSEHKHARQHYGETQHPLIQSVEPGEYWGYCYADELLIKRIPSV